MDLTELPIELKKQKSNNNNTYLFNIINHFSKFGMSFLLKNKDSKTILKYLKTALECNGYPTELGSDNGKEFCNELVENYLKEKSVEHFHKTIKNTLYCMYNDEPENFDIKAKL